MYNLYIYNIYVYITKPVISRNIWICGFLFLERGFILLHSGRNIKGNEKGNTTCYARERANTKPPF